MASEIRVNKINNRAGLGTVEYTPTGIIVSGIVTAYEFDGNFDTTPGIVVTGIATAAAIDLNGDLDVDGHTNLDNVSVAGVSTFSGNILPGTDSSHNIGSNSVRFANVYGDALYGVIQNTTHTNITRVGTLSQLAVSGTANPLNVTHTGANCVNLNRGSKSVGIDVNYGGSDTHSLVSLTTGMDLRFKLGGADRIVFKSDGHIEPQTDSQINLGSNTVRFANVYADTLYGDGSNLTGITGTTINNNADNRVITGSGTANTLEADANLTWNNSTGQLVVGASGSGYISVRKPAIAQVDIQHSTTNSYSRLYMSQSSGSGGYFAINKLGTVDAGYTGGVNAVQLWSSAAAPMIFATNNAEKLRITSDGSVYHTGGGNNRRYSFATDGTSHYISFDNTLNGIKLNGYGGITFETNGTNERARIDGSGNFMIGSTSAEAKLDVTGGVSISSNGVTVSPSGYDLKIRSNTGKLGIHIDNSSGTPTLEFGTGNATTGGAITTNSHGIFLKPGGADKLKVEPDGVRSFATFVDTSYHANPDPFADGSGLAYYRMNYNFQDSGLYGFHGTGSQGSPNKEFNASPHFSLVNSSGEPCWDNPHEGAINIPNLKNSYPFTMAAWINLSSWPTTTNNDLIMNLNINGQRVSLCVVCWSGTNYSDFSIMYGGTNHWVFAPTSRPTNQWIHVVYSVVGSNNSSHAVYQNGTALSATNRGGGHGGGAGYAIGGNAGNSERFAIGRIGSIRFFNKAISSSEASALYTNDTFYT